MCIYLCMKKCTFVFTIHADIKSKNKSYETFQIWTDFLLMFVSYNEICIQRCNIHPGIEPGPQMLSFSSLVHTMEADNSCHTVLLAYIPCSLTTGLAALSVFTGITNTTMSTVFFFFVLASPSPVWSDVADSVRCRIWSSLEYYYSGFPSGFSSTALLIHEGMCASWEK